MPSSAPYFSFVVLINFKRITNSLSKSSEELYCEEEILSIQFSEIGN